MPAKNKNMKAKEMFKSYDAAEVPDIMPFPELGGVATTKGEETAVPKLNEHQQSWILDIGLKGKAAKTFYEKVKTDAFDAKAFQHTPQPTDRVEEARLPALAIQKVISNKRTAENNKRKTKNDDTSPIAETIAETAALSKLLGLVASSGRDQFRQDRYDDILEYSKTLTDAINAGSKFRKAEGL
ncbi:hypothetical protein B0H13DRAFT_1902370, partial [Mycena leptocephala]